MRTGGSTSVSQTLTSCPGQCYHPFLTIDLAAFHFPLKAPREPAPGEAPAENLKRSSVPSLEASREQHLDDPETRLRPVQQISESLHVTTRKSQSLPGRLKEMAQKPLEKQGVNAEEPEERKVPVETGLGSRDT